MATAIAHTFKPTRSRVLALVAILAILFGCYGLLSAQQARSADPSAALEKHVWGGIRGDATIVFQKHITAVVRAALGAYRVTFDRHVDNCSLQVTARNEGTGLHANQFTIGPGPGGADEIVVFESDPTGSSLRDGDFDILGMCPST